MCGKSFFASIEDRDCTSFQRELPPGIRRRRVRNAFVVDGAVGSASPFDLGACFQHLNAMAVLILRQRMASSVASECQPLGLASTRP